MYLNFSNIVQKIILDVTHSISSLTMKATWQILCFICHTLKKDLPLGQGCFIIFLVISAQQTVAQRFKCSLDII